MGSAPKRLKMTGSGPQLMASCNMFKISCKVRINNGTSNYTEWKVISFLSKLLSKNCAVLSLRRQLSMLEVSGTKDYIVLLICFMNEPIYDRTYIDSVLLLSKYSRKKILNY